MLAPVVGDVLPLITALKKLCNHPRFVLRQWDADTDMKCTGTFAYFLQTSDPHCA